jgi:hypothetical protein
MATTTKDYEGNGSKGIDGQEVLTFTFPYLKIEDIKVSLNGATLATTKYTFPTATSIQFNALSGSPTTLETNTQENTGAPKQGVKILIYRDTDVDAAKAVFAAGSSIRSRDLNDNKEQDLFFQQEVQDPANPKNKPNSLNGTGAPDQGLGKEGDVYIDTTNNSLYGPKTDGAWGSGTNLAGVIGVTGTAPITSTGGDSPVIGISAATTSAAGSISAADKTKLDGIETSADVTDATNVDAAGAVMNSDSTTASMSFVVDEDNMSSNSATKVPTQQSVKAYVDTEVAGVVDSAPSALDTLNELAAALGDDVNFSTTVTNSIGTKLPLAGGTMTGNIVMSGSQTVDGRDVSADGTKLDGIASGAEVNVQADFNETDNTNDAFIKNKPTIPTNNNQLTNGAGFTTNTGTVTGVSGTAPITSSGGTTPAIGISAATTSDAGSMSAADKTKLDSLQTNFIPGWANSTNRTINTRLQDTVNAADFGATGNGSTNDTTALQNAINYVVQNPGKELVINAGIYNVTSTITATLDAKSEQLHIRGGGNVIIKFNPQDSNQHCLKVDIDSNQYASDVSTGAPRVSISNIEFAYDGSTNGIGQAIRLEGSNVQGRHTQRCVIHNCQFVPYDDLGKVFSVGVYVYDLHEVAFDNCSFYQDNNSTGNQLNTGVQIDSSGTSASPAHYYFSNCTFLYGNAGIRVERYTEGLYINNCGFVANDNGIEYFAITDSLENAVEPGLQITNSHFNTDTNQSVANGNYGVRTRGVVDVLIANNLFYSGKDGQTAPSSQQYRGCIYIEEGGRFNIANNNFVNNDGGVSLSNYSNTAITVASQSIAALSSVKFGLIQGNTFDSFKSSGAVWLQNTTGGEVVVYEELNIFKNCTNKIVDQQGSNTTSLAVNIAAATTSTAGSMSAADKTKLDGIESGATADQTDAEIKTAYENNSDTNAFTDAEKTKLSGIEANATADQTAEEIQDIVGAMLTSNTETGITVTYQDADGTIDFAVASQTDENFTTADHSKLDGIESNATADQTGAEIKSLYEGESDTNAYTDAEKTKLSGIETNATADQTASEIRTLVESASDSNVFTDADHTKLNGIEASADVTDAANVKSAMESFTSSVIIPDNIAIRFGADSNLRIFHDAGDDWSYITETDDEAEGLRIRGQNLVLEDNSGDNYILCEHDGKVILYHDAASKLYTQSFGIEVRGDGSSQDAAIKLNCSQNSHGVKIQSPPHSANASYTLTLPNDTGSANQVLKTDGSGNLDWVDQSSGSSGVAATGGTFTGSVTFEDAINENVFAISDASSVALDPDNGMIQTWTLGANRTATDSLTSGQSVLLMITAGSYTLTWPTITWAGGSAPTLSTSSTTAIELWKVGSTLYGANVGDV